MFLGIIFVLFGHFLVGVLKPVYRRLKASKCTTEWAII